MKEEPQDKRRKPASARNQSPSQGGEAEVPGHSQNPWDRYGSPCTVAGGGSSEQQVTDLDCSSAGQDHAFVCV